MRALRCSQILRARTSTRYLAPLTRNERHSLSRADRARGRVKKALGGRLIPFIETEWGRRRLRRLRVRVKAEQEFLAHEEDLELREQKRQESLKVSANLPLLSASDIEEIYLSLMAPPAFPTSALPLSSAPLLTSQGASDVPLVELTTRLQLRAPSSETELVQGGSSAVSDTLLTPAQLDVTIKALESRLSETTFETTPSEKAMGKLSAESGLATAAEWLALLEQAVRHCGLSPIARILTLMRRSGAVVDTSVLSQVMGIYADMRQVDAAEVLLRYLEDSEPQNMTNQTPFNGDTLADGHQVDAPVHHQVLRAHIAVGDIDNAQFYLRALEHRGILPAEASYQLVLDTLLQRKRITSAWDLFSHCRAAAYPVPSEKMWATMISACAPSDRYASPERAFDLRQEMHDKAVAIGPATYTALCRVCAKSGDPKYYLESLQLLRDMIKEGHTPTRDLLIHVLEGASRDGDLARARWIFTQMANAAQAGDASMAPTSRALASLLIAHVNYRRRLQPLKVVQAEQQADEHSTAHTHTSNSAGNDANQRDHSSDMLEFPGPMPRTWSSVLASARSLFERYARVVKAKQVAADGIARGKSITTVNETAQDDPDRSSSSHLVGDLAFADMSLDYRVLDAYLAASRAYGVRLADLHDIYRTLWGPFGMVPSDSSTAMMLSTCLKRYKYSDAAAIGTAVFGEYIERLGSDVLRLEPGDGSVALARYSRYTSRIWTRMISLLASLNQLSPALKLTSQFAVLYPPALITQFARRVVDSQERVPSPEIALASSDYAETSTFHAGPVPPPELVFSDIRTLHAALKSREAAAGTRWLASVLRQYTDARQAAERIIRGNDAMPDGDNAPIPLDASAVSAASSLVAIEAPKADTLAEQRVRMLAHFDLAHKQSKHGRQVIPDMTDVRALRADGQILPQRSISSPPQRNRLTAVLRGPHRSLSRSRLQIASKPTIDADMVHQAAV